MHVDTVVAATGYCPGLEPLVFTTADEDPFFRAVVRTAQKLGP
jgi:hypothetical protein